MSSSSPNRRRFDAMTSPLHRNSDDVDVNAQEDDAEDAGEELIGDHMMDLDTEDMTAEQREAAEHALDQRDANDLRRTDRRRLPGALMDIDEDVTEQPRRRRLQPAVASDMQFGQPAAAPEVYVNIDDMTGSVRDLLGLENVYQEVGRRFLNFLSTYTDTSSARPTLVYFDRITTMCKENSESLIVSYVHMTKHVPKLAVWLADSPQRMLEIMDSQTTLLTLTAFPEYTKVHKKIHVRIHDLPVHDSLRDLRQVHLNCMIKTSGVVTRRTNVLPQLAMVKYNCVKCGFVMGPFVQSGDREITPGSCSDCQSKGPFMVNQEQTIYRNYQKITIQESPGSVPPGRVPRTKDVILLYDLIDQVRPGEEVEVTGQYVHSYDTALNTKNGFPVFATIIEANYLSKHEGVNSQFVLTQEDTDEINRLSKLPDVFDRIVRSIAPSIYGHKEIKTAIALALFGGEAIEYKDKPRQRGDINCLVLGDPGTAKSQILKYIEKTSHRAVYTTGKVCADGASAVGLTASVHLDPLTREWTLEGGALVLADRGVCLIDEFDKMNEQDRTSIHEAMEQQSISISKAGIVTSLQARCSVIAAANPIGGRYDSALTFSENVELTDPILSRFDVLAVVRDTVDPVEDEKLASYVVSSHARSHPHYGKPEGDQWIENGDPLGIDRVARLGMLTEEEKKQREDTSIPQNILRKYIYFARLNIHPKLDDIDKDKVAQLYVDLRQQSMMSGAVPIAVRHIQSLVRLAQAHAKVHLRDRVREDDVDLSIRVMLESFINAQKFSVMKSMRKHFSKYITFKKDHNELLLHSLQQLMRENRNFLLEQNLQADDNTSVEISIEEFENRARELGIHSVDAFYSSFMFTNNLYILQQRDGKIIKRFV